MDKLPSLGRAIFEVLGPTFNAYEPLLAAKADEIRTTRRSTHQYGPEARQALDVYYSPDASPPSASAYPGAAKPVLVFCYGGGFVGGNKAVADYADGVVFANIGHFFAAKYGFTVVVPDYRLLQHGAKFPSGGEDVRLVVDWIVGSLAAQDGFKGGPIDLFLMGNSAGGVHVATYLLHPDYAASREAVLAAERKKGDEVALRGVLYLGVPFHWGKEDNEVLTNYFGAGQIYAHSPIGLLQAAKAKAGGAEPRLPGVKTAVLVSELDPEFVADTAEEMKAAWPSANLDIRVLKGHNHISPQLGLGTGIEREEEWGVQVAEFCQSCASK
ncbi:alpha/beta-hydrolase [Xylariomycetidae sp. FL0641]|nr:alpha/beta-hydrolase [Xylariomycetidae sp. FL0641]